MMTLRKTFSPADAEAFIPSEKVGLVATISPEGRPHISLITSMRVKGPTELILGEFVKGASKRNLQQNPHAGFLVMTFAKEMWRGKATWTHLAKEGPEYEEMNLIPMFRYNTYFGINTVHYLSLEGVTERLSLPMGRVVREALKTVYAKQGVRDRSAGGQAVLHPYVQRMVNGLTSLKFLSYIQQDGYPVIIPIIQCQTPEGNTLAFSGGVFQDELDAIPKGADVAVFCMNFGIEDVLMRGTFGGFRRSRGVKMGTVSIDWVYNSMPPALGQIYPPVELRPCTDFTVK